MTASTTPCSASPRLEPTRSDWPSTTIKPRLAGLPKSPAPADLVTFYCTIGDVTWVHIGSGYFFEPTSNVLQRLQEDRIVDGGTDGKVHDRVIASNVAGPDGRVYRTRTPPLGELAFDRAANGYGSSWNC
ncbi:hypothetical protein AB0G87_12045 [Streptomyces asoensis]|uniref:hypothetical protein n=1 Tax=Streptomyces asoensis TaxID=249586 RepID=UPI00340F88FA